MRCLFAAHWRAARLRPHIDLKHRGQREEGEGTFVIDFVVKEAGESKAGGQGNSTTLPCVRIPWQQTAPKLPSRPQARSLGRRRRTLTSDTLGRFFGDNKGKKALVLCGSHTYGVPICQDPEGRRGAGTQRAQERADPPGQPPSSQQPQGQGQGPGHSHPGDGEARPGLSPRYPPPPPLEEHRSESGLRRSEAAKARSNGLAEGRRAEGRRWKQKNPIKEQGGSIRAATRKV